jgi:hypothetical protein
VDDQAGKLRAALEPRPHPHLPGLIDAVGDGLDPLELDPGHDRRGFTSTTSQ